MLMKTAMSKRAQSAERKYYGVLYSGQMKNEREGFIKGYDQAEKDTIERACKWLFSHLPILIDYYDEDIYKKADRSDLIKLFRTQMEEQ